MRVCYENLNLCVFIDFGLFAEFFREFFQRLDIILWGLILSYLLYKASYLPFICSSFRFEKMWVIDVDTGAVTVDLDQGFFSVQIVHFIAC